MKTIKKYILGVAALAALTGCKDKMTELNTNPGIIQQTNPEYMFYGAFTGGNSVGLYRLWNGQQIHHQFNGVGAVMQYSISNGGGTKYGKAIDESQPSPYAGFYWSDFFNGTGNKLTSMVQYIDKMKPEEQTRYRDLRAKGKITITYMAWKVFDVYGAMPYSEAFRGQEGFLKPKYDLYKNIYEQLDDTLKQQVANLELPLSTDNITTGAFDGFYGVKLTAKNEGGSTQTVRSDADARKLWAKFANALRLKMAFRVAKRNPAFFQKVVAEVEASPSGVMTSVEEGCEFIDGYTTGNATDTDNQMAYYAQATMPFVNSLKVAEDPRLPIYMRPNGNDTLLYMLNDASGTSYSGFAFLYKHFPDSLKEMGYYNSTTGFRGQLDWMGRLDQGNVWMGRPVNPAVNGVASKFPGFAVQSDDYISVSINNPAGEGDFVSPVTGEVLFNGKNRIYKWLYVTKMQARLWTKIWQGGFDKADNRKGNEPAQDNARMTEKVLTYSDQCFTMSLISNELGRSVSGKSAEDWYFEGIRAGLKEANTDAKRTYIPICVSTNYPVFPPYNGTDADPIPTHVYTIDDAIIEDYVAKHPVSRYTGGLKEAVAVQAWFSMMLNPEEMWAYWKLTGYPRQVDYPVATPDAVRIGSLAKVANTPWITASSDKDVYEQLPTIPAFERPYSSGPSDPMDWPRRAVVPTPNVGNIDNYYEVQKALMDTEGFGSQWSKTSTRIWWDNHSTPVVGY